LGFGNAADLRAGNGVFHADPDVRQMTGIPHSFTKLDGPVVSSHPAPAGIGSIVLIHTHEDT
jgi:hypothetical protein